MPPSIQANEKPAKPTADYPLFAHATRRWAKKIRGKLVYFGPWADPDGALARWLAIKDDLLAGRTPDTRPRPNRVSKPKKPAKDFPLFAHATGRWAKKVKGKLCYFGPWSDWQAALEKWLEQKDDLLAGRRPRKTGDGLSAADACNHYLTAKDRKVQAGEMQRRTWLEYKSTCELLIAAFGRNRLVSDLGADDFGELRASFAKGTKKARGPEALGNHIQRVRCLFKWVYEAGLIDKPVRFGPDFVRPGKVARRKNRQAKPARLFSAVEIKKLLKAASVPMRAMIYLGVNCGMGNTDCSELRSKHLDLKAGILDYPRPKTAIERRAVLWPETIKALRAAIEDRPDPKDEADNDRVFITRYGQPWVRFRETGNVNSVTLEFGKLLADTGMVREGVNFYALRHTFETVAGEIGDQAAVDRVMGHERPDMASVYREWTKDKREDERLKKVTNHVHAWLFAKPKQ